MEQNPESTFELFGKRVKVSSLCGADAIGKFYQLMESDMRSAYAYAFHKCLTYADSGKPVYATPEEALGAPLREWSVVRDAWLSVNWPEKNG